MKSGAELLDEAKRRYRPHAWAYGCVVLPAVLLMLFLPAWWLFWPIMAWTFVFAVHFLLVRSLEVSGDWVEERVARTADKAYDIGHIEDIRDSYEASVARAEGARRPEAPKDADRPKEEPSENPPQPPLNPTERGSP